MCMQSMVTISITNTMVEYMYASLLPIYEMNGFELMQKGYTNKETGKVVNRDHSTVIHSCKKVEGLMQFDQKFKELVKSFG